MNRKILVALVLIAVTIILLSLIWGDMKSRFLSKSQELSGARAMIPVRASEQKVFKQAWFEAGLLYRYSIDQFIQVLRDFNFDSVLVQPLQNTPYENVTIGDEVYSLCDAIDSYADSHADFSKFLIVGWASDYYAPLVEKFKSRGYVYVLDDGGRDFEKTKTSLQVLKTYNVETGLVVYPPSNNFSAVKHLINEGFVDYLMPCFYPFFTNVDWFNSYSKALTVFKSWTEGKCKFLPAIQVFSGGTENVTWRFPSSNEVQACLNVLIDLDADGITWFLPFTGQSERGESFEGFLDHSEVWEIIENPQPKPLPFSWNIPKEVLLVVMPPVIALAVYAVKKFYDWRKTENRALCFKPALRISLELPSTISRTHSALAHACSKD